MICLPYLVRRSASEAPEERTLFVREDAICKIEQAELQPGYTLVTLDKSDAPLLCPLDMGDWKELFEPDEPEEEPPCNPVG